MQWLALLTPHRAGGADAGVVTLVITLQLQIVAILGTYLLNSALTKQTKHINTFFSLWNN